MKFSPATPFFKLPTHRALLLHLLAEDLKFRSLSNSLHPMMTLGEEWQLDLFPVIREMMSPTLAEEFYDLRADFWAQQCNPRSMDSLEDCSLLLFAELCTVDP